MVGVRGAEPGARRVELLQFADYQAGVEVDVAPDGEDGDAPVFNA